MYRVYNCLVVEHDPLLLLLAAAFCILASITSLAVVQRGVRARRPSTRLRWLLFGGAVTGVGIWTTHFAAMLAFNPGVRVAIDRNTAVAAVILAALLSVAGWLAAFLGRRRGALGGAIVGLALAVAHFTDMIALRVDGLVRYDADLIAASLLVGIALCAVAGDRLARQAGERMPLAAGLILAGGVLSLHFLAMSAVSIIPGPPAATIVAALDLEQFAPIVVTSALSVIMLGLMLARYDQ